MKCPRCGQPANFVIKADIDGMEKHIIFCKKCMLETFKFDSSDYAKAGTKLLATHIEYVEEIYIGSKDFVEENLRILTLMPLAIQGILFKSDELSRIRMTKEINTRQIYFLKQRLKLALKAENYELANNLKKQIKQLENMSEI
ncbi:hypothetical protein [Thermosipho atlanticus]|uniref:Protein-arginine kinase activator protein McsA n=1 Tax=Thermosipho atlanticus DSM 15807 TaxID=1123380 RepID=A0A1M5RZ56_9BACT|nr:hypothetical protein [Thermosipho atlanticus]SHH31454.1 hypothetical protein SAMN02745199_0706 [Thermosipho atlanticus DSM 15807]